MAQSSAVLFADIAGSSCLYKQIGDNRAKEAVFSCFHLMQQLAEEHGGTVVKTIGDELMVRFHSADEAFKAACAIQWELESNLNNGPSLSVKIGIHFGPVIFEKNDIFGDTVNTAARMVSIANAKQIVVSEDAAAVLSAEFQAQITTFDCVKIKSFQKDSILYLVDWRQSAGDCGNSTTISFDDQDLKMHKTARGMHLVYQSRDIMLSPQLDSFNVGRDQDVCDLVVQMQYASRKHFWIEYRRGKFVLVDHSTNGTWVKMDDEKEIYLKREELPLWGRGLISAGQPLKCNLSHRIEFFH
ncbi:adenylate/guanylate cyclase domain-containing protein [Hahella aquimaris]|uniref:adenylate/guanylate cyclase domain-containing protein n=1 Tax=Hahella sp. HNIBRBA332 TaxID=3015983 RepID=UPI00273C4CE0|nr:adenylate/guanylate cyclase domain-containing protein [Hahella sp. HNIBRBA332]WLQ16317.1 adenylate/guanylate cyclase domain-containing protein [Hahella sp. HNIBRBA332]